MYQIFYRDHNSRWRALESQPPAKRIALAYAWCRDHPVKGREYRVAYVGDPIDWHTIE
jgi:hypothetical protein